MKNYCLAFICCSFSIIAFAQAPKPKTTPKQPIAGAASKTQRPVTSVAKTKSAEKEAPKPVLSPAELRMMNTNEQLSFMIGCGEMFSNEHNLYTDRRKYTEYTDVTDTSVTVLLKNILGHTTDRIIVTYDSARVKRMVQYTTKKKSYSAPDNNAVWITKLDYSYFFKYDSTQPNRVVTIGKAGGGLENKDYAVVKYFITYRNDAVDSVECIDHTRLKYNCVYYNGKKRAERIHRYSYKMDGSKPVGFIEYAWNYKYEGANSTEREQLYQEKTAYQGLTLNKTILSEKGEMQKTLLLNRHAIYGTQDVLLNAYEYDATGHLSAGKEYKTSLYTPPTASAIDSLGITTTPHVSSYSYNDKDQVVERKISYHDKCLDSEEIITYTIGIYGFVTETKSKKDSKHKCSL